MGQREDVTASLLASHGVDAVARRKVAEKVKAVVVEGAREIEDESPDVNADELATAASAVVLASDLRAPQSAASPSNPVDGICRIILPMFDRLNEDGRDG